MRVNIKKFLKKTTTFFSFLIEKGAEHFFISFLLILFISLIVSVFYFLSIKKSLEFSLKIERENNRFLKDLQKVMEILEKKEKAFKEPVEIPGFSLKRK
jgi:hypothetical protein